MLYQQSLFFIPMEPPGLPSKKQKVYTLCKNLIAVAITLIALIPIIYILGSDQVLYPSRPLFSAYAEDPYFQAKITEIQASLSNNLVVNLHLQGKENSRRQWEHLQEFVRYLGYRFNRQDVATVNRLIVPAEVKPQKKGKNAPSAESLRLMEEAYAFINNGQMNVLRNKLNKVALNTINRLKIKQKEVKNGGISDSIKKTIIDEVVAPKVWIITIHPQNWKYHSSEELKKQITALSKEREKDSFVVVSLGPADPEWKKMKAMPINIDQNFFSSIKGKLKQIIKASLPFEINTTRVIESVLCHYQTSLYQLNNFIQNCNSTFSCYNSIKLLLKKTKKGEDSRTLELLNELCNIGDLDEEDYEFKKVLNNLGFYGDHGVAQESIKLYFEIANGKKCKGAKQCNYQWLMKEQKSQQNQAKLQSPKNLQTNKTETPVKEKIKTQTPVQTVTQASKKEKLTNNNKPKSTNSKEEGKVLQKPKKQSKKEEEKPKIKQNKAKTAQIISKKKLKQKIVKSPKTIEKSQEQCLKPSSKLECQDKAGQKKQVKVQQIQKVEENPEEKIEVVDDSQQVIVTNESSQQLQAQQTENQGDIAQSDEDKQKQSKEDVKKETVEIAEALIQTQNVENKQEEAVAVEVQPKQSLVDEQHLQVVGQEEQTKPAQIQNQQQAIDEQAVIEQIIPTSETENAQNDASETFQTQIQQDQEQEPQNKQQTIQQDEQVPIETIEPNETNETIESLPNQTENQEEPSQTETPETPETTETTETTENVEQQQVVVAVQTEEAIVPEQL